MGEQDQRMDIWEAGYRAGRADTEYALKAISTHNGTPVTPHNLRYAATHEALTRSWIYDLLMGLAEVLTPAAPPPDPPDREAGAGESGVGRG